MTTESKLPELTFDNEGRAILLAYCGFACPFCGQAVDVQLVSGDKVLEHDTSNFVRCRPFDNMDQGEYLTLAEAMHWIECGYYAQHWRK